jgi:hypothetical protein
MADMSKAKPPKPRRNQFCLVIEAKPRAPGGAHPRSRATLDHHGFPVDHPTNRSQGGREGQNGRPARAPASRTHICGKFCLNPKNCSSPDYLELATAIQRIMHSVVLIAMFARASSAIARLCMSSHIGDLEVCAMANAKREQVTVTLDPGLRAAIKRAAEAEHRSMSNQIKHLVARALEQQREGAAA